MTAYGARQPCDRGQIEAPRRRADCPRRDKPWVLATAILGSSLAFIEGSGVNLALPALQSGFALDSAAVQWVVNSYLLVLGSFMLVGGSLGDRFGLRRIFVLGNAVFGLGALACALAPSPPILLAARCVQGAGGALLVPTSLALIGAYFTEQERGRAIGTWAGASALTTAIGPVLGGWLVDRWGWPAVFWLVVPLSVTALAIAVRRVPPDEGETREPLDYAGALLLAAALATLIYGLVDAGPAWGRALALALAAAAGAAFAIRERRCESPILPFELFRSRPFSGANLMTLLLYAALSGSLYFLPFNLIQVQGYSATQAGAAFLPMTLLLGFGSSFAGDLIRRFDPRRVLTVGPVVAGAGFLALAWPGTDASFVTGFLPGIVIIGVGMTISVAPLTTVVMSSVAERRSGVASGINNTVSRIAGVMAVAALTALAIARFSAVLDAELEAAGVPAAAAERLLDGAARLAELKPPPGMAASVEAAARAAVASSYVATFRLLTVVCGLLAMLSGAVAWFTLSPAPGGRPR